MRNKLLEKIRVLSESDTAESKSEIRNPWLKLVDKKTTFFPKPNTVF